MDKSALFSAIASRNHPSDIESAGAYLRALAACLDGSGPCDPALFGAKSLEHWGQVLKEADGHLTHSNDQTIIGDLGTKGQALTAGSILDFDCVITATVMDRDRDVLKSSGARLDPAAPLLLFHNPEMPVGKLVNKIAQNDRLLSARCCIFNTTLGRDAAILVEGGALRISHGFDPTEYEPLKNGRYLITSFDIYEISLVPVPSNPAAVITAFSRGKLYHPFMKAYGKRLFDERQVQIQGTAFKTGQMSTFDMRAAIESGSVAKPTCSCHAKATIAPGKDKLAAAELEATDPIRWNKSASKHFDVANAELLPSSTSYDWASKYLGVPIKQIFETAENIPSARIGSWLTAFQKLTKDLPVEDIRNIHGNYESPPVYDTIQLTSKQSGTFLIEGTTFYKNVSAPLIIGIEATWYGVRLTGFSRLVDSKFLTDLFAKTWQLAREQNFLKGEAFSLSGEFIERDELNWSDVFLTEKNQKPLTRTVLNINAKGANCPNRGLILMGPPGTGKTLSGRVIKNQAQATFIWISARDFARSGSFGGFEYAFDLAKELAPCVLFFEDIDNWIGQSTVDLMKTEMDGLTRSAGITTIMTTNFPEHLPEALVDRPGRFHDVLKIDLPNDEIRKAMLRKWITGIPDDQITSAVARTKGYSGAHIYELAQFAKSIVESDDLGISQALVKALDKIDEQRDLISRNLLGGSHYSPRKDISMSIPTDSILKAAQTTNTGRVYEDNEGNRGQGPQAGDHDFPERHMAEQVITEIVPGLDAPKFDPANGPEDAVFSIATGANTGAQQNPSDPATALSNNEGIAGQPPLPGPGVVSPAPTNPSVNPGAQRSALPPGGKDVNDASFVQPLDSDSPAHHDTAGNIDTHVDVDVPHLKAMARVIQHSGKEGSVYLNAKKGHVHHVMSPEDVHPERAHRFHSASEIGKMYGVCHGVTGTKCSVSTHPSKGMGYTLIHKGTSGSDDDMMTSAATVAVLKEVKDHLEVLAGAGEAHISKMAKVHVMAAGNRLIDLIKATLRKAGMDTNPNGEPAVSGVPTENVTNATTSAHFTGTPAQNALDTGSMSHFGGLPTENAGAADSTNNVGPIVGKATPAAGVVSVPPALVDRPRTDPNMNGGVDAINISESVSEQPIDPEKLMKWLAGEEISPVVTETKSPEDLEFDALLAESLFETAGT